MPTYAPLARPVTAPKRPVAIPSTTILRRQAPTIPNELRDLAACNVASSMAPKRAAWSNVPWRVY